MGLLEDMLELLKADEGLTPIDVRDELDNVEWIEDEYIDSLRWSELWLAVFRRDSEYVGLSYQVPATEYQEGGDFESEVYAVKPRVIKKTVWDKV